MNLDFQYLNPPGIWLTNWLEKSFILDTENSLKPNLNLIFSTQNSQIGKELQWK